MKRRKAAKFDETPRLIARTSLSWLIVCTSLACSLLFVSFFQSFAIASDIQFPTPSPNTAISVQADSGSQSKQGNYLVYQLKGNVRIQQGQFKALANEAVLWVDDMAIPDEKIPGMAIVYLDGQCRVEWSPTQRLEAKDWMGRLFSHQAVQVQTPRWENPPAEPPKLDWSKASSSRTTNRYNRPGESTASAVTAAQFQQPPASSSLETLPNPTPPAMLNPAQRENVPVPSTLGPPASGPPAVPTPMNRFGVSEQAGSNGYGLPHGGVVIDESGRSNSQIDLSPLSNGSSGQIPMAAPPSETTESFQPPVAPIPGVSNFRSFQISGRTNQEVQIRATPRPERGDSVITVSGGLRIQVGGVQMPTASGQTMPLGNVLLEADRAVIWARDLSELISQGVGDEPLEIYLEGNIVFQQGPRVIYADRMYYNVQSEYGMVLSAEILTPVEQYEGLVRLKADVVQQRSRDNFLAYDAAITSSRLGIPRYWLQAGKVELTDQRRETIDPLTGQPRAISTPGSTDMHANARNNFFYLGGLPIFYWPILSTNIERPSFYLTGIKVKNDQIFGTQTMLDWDPYQILGIDPIPGTDWLFSTDYLSKRGFAVGTNFSYDRPNGFLPGPTAGFFDIWAIQDSGLDVLGSDRNNLTPEETTRGRALFRHRKYFSPDLEFIAEAGWVSDRNFMEQFFEREWDMEKDYSTTLRFRRYADTRLLDIWGQARINEFYTESEWLPRLDHYALGQSLLADRLTWYAHTSVGYGKVRVATTPVNAAEAAKFTLQSGEVEAEGLRAITRHELSAPLNFGRAKLVPYIGGEAGFWGEDVTGNDLTRLTGQGGLRTSIPVWKLYPNVESRLLNIRGINHKLTWHSDIFYADSSQNLDQLPLYDPLDDNSQEHFRRRLVTNTFAGALPAQFESRNYAIRSGMQRWVSATSMETVEDQLQARLGLNQRWQTKRGRLGRERITDLVELDMDMIVFPKADRDNFSEYTGGYTYDFRYHIGDRVTLLSDGYFDVFEQGLKLISIGTMISRPGRGEWYTGLTSIEGPVSSTIASSTFNYRMSEKWIITGGTAFDFGRTGNIGQTVALTRIGESFLTKVGINVDSGRDNVAFQFSLEPRFLQKRRLGAVAGELIPPAGLYGLE